MRWFTTSLVIALLLGASPAVALDETDCPAGYNIILGTPGDDSIDGTEGKARELVLRTARGAASVGLADPQRELSDILQSLATPGGITAQGLDVLTEAKVREAWTRAFAAVHQRLTADS